jgi:predicted component of type VI protein secretion system
MRDVLEIALLRNQSPVRHWRFQSNERIRIGRDFGDSSSIHVPFKFASRRHATVELRSRQLIVMDTSTNGTFQIDTSCRLPQGSEKHFSLEVPVTLRLGHKLDGRDLQFSLIQELAGPIVFDFA